LKIGLDLLRCAGILGITEGGKMEKKLQEIIDSSWSNYSDLDYWIEEMNRRSDRIPKWVLKMAMKHLRSDFYKIHKIACDLKGD
jgi:hypothetical protein